MIDSSHPNLSVRKQSVVLDLSRSAVYYKPKLTVDDGALANAIAEIWAEMPFYGYRKITRTLHREGWCVNRKRVLRVMQEMNICALYPKPRTTIVDKQHKKYPYLLQELDINRINQVWATDITYIKLPTGFVYLAAIIDVYSRYIVSWRLSNTMDTEFCLEMLSDAFKHGTPEILNTDQGSQFTSNKWTEKVKSAGIQVSMDGKGRWVDNVIIERFWRSIKHEHLATLCYQTVKEAEQAIGKYIDLYNNKRLHQNLDYQTPAEVYMPYAGGALLRKWEFTRPMDMWTTCKKVDTHTHRPNNNCNRNYLN